MQSILITGCNRGLGLGLVKSLVSLENAPRAIIATCRKPTEAKELQDIASQHKNVKVVQFVLFRGVICLCFNTATHRFAYFKIRHIYKKYNFLCGKLREDQNGTQLRMKTILPANNIVHKPHLSYLSKAKKMPLTLTHTQSLSRR